MPAKINDKISTTFFPVGFFLFMFVINPLSLQAQNTSSDSTAANNQNQSGTVVTENSRKGKEGLSTIENIPEGAVKFQSADSLILDLRKTKKALLIGSAVVSHSSGELKAGRINMNIDSSLVEAETKTPQDTLSQPVLKRDSDEIRSNRILFNYTTGKGKFEAARVQVADGNLMGSKVKNINESEVFIEDGIYSTCPPEYLYYYIKAKRMKVVDQDELFFSNARLYILDIPYPLIFPFGYVPTDIKQKQSGLLTPTYAFQNQAQRGIGLQNLGWFQYFSDYFTAQIDGDIYTSGSFYLNSILQYRKRDKYTGSINLGYSRERGLEPTDPDFQRAVQRSIAVRHSQDISPYARLSADVNLRTANYFRQNSYDIDERAQRTSNSKLSYTYNQPENLFNFSTSAQLAQNFANNSTNLTGPSASFRLKPVSPFQNNDNDQSWYETINLNYSSNLSTRFNYNPIDADSAEVGFIEALTDPAKYREATGDNDYIRAGLEHQAGISVGQIIPSQFLNISAGLNLNEYWYPTSIRKRFNEEQNEIITEKEIGFVSAREFNASLNFNTTLYGISNRRIGKLQGFRHTFRPTVGFSFSPDFSDDFWGYYRTVQADTNGNTQRYSIFEDEIFRGPGSGEQRNLFFSFSNVFETKIVDRDSTGEVNERTLRLIDNLSVNSSYNLAADSLNLNDLNTRLSSNAINGININASARFSFYERDDNGRKVNRFLFNEGGKMAQLETFSLNVSTSLRGGSRGAEVFSPVYKRQYDPYDQSVFRPIDPRFGYQPVDPLQSPWSFSLSFRYSWNYRFGQDPRKTAVINARNISFNLTPKWNFSTSIGYDFIQKELTPSQFALSRSLECWNLAFQINPFGDFQYYFFSLSVNSAQIQSLFQKLPLLKNLERSSSPTGRGF